MGSCTLEVTEVAARPDLELGAVAIRELVRLWCDLADPTGADAPVEPLELCPESALIFEEEEERFEK